MGSDGYNYSSFERSTQEFTDFAVRAPEVTMRAPSFALEDLATGEMLEMKCLWKSNIVVIEFGSFT
jgi:hypothetical protein